jgi:hypothetical protein
MVERYRQLLFVPVQQDAVLDSTLLASALAGLGFIGKQIATQWPQRFYIGDRFLQHLNFMGCAPALEFVPADASRPDWSAFTFISLHDPWPTSRCLIDPMMAKPVCPQCGKRHALTEQVQLYLEMTLTCPHCQTHANLAKWDWREFGGCGRQFISIVNVYPKEALPTEDLLRQLHEVTRLEWRYFYMHGSLLDDSL